MIDLKENMGVLLLGIWLVILIWLLSGLNTAHAAPEAASPAVPVSLHLYSGQQAQMNIGRPCREEEAQAVLYTTGALPATLVRQFITCQSGRASLVFQVPKNVRAVTPMAWNIPGENGETRQIPLTVYPVTLLDSVRRWSLRHRLVLHAAGERMARFLDAQEVQYDTPRSYPAGVPLPVLRIITGKQTVPPEQVARYLMAGPVLRMTEVPDTFPLMEVTYPHGHAFVDMALPSMDVVLLNGPRGHALFRRAFAYAASPQPALTD